MRSIAQDWAELKGELGDLLFQSVYHAQMAAEAGHFAFADVVARDRDKMVARHPHVFGDESRDKTAADADRATGNGSRRQNARPGPQTGAFWTAWRWVCRG